MNATATLLGGDPGTPPSQRSPVTINTPLSARTLARAAADAKIALPLMLVRSYTIPLDDPSYNRLLNLSWTYDSAVAAAAFAASGDKANAGQVLDQLAALQRADGSVEIVFNTATGESAPIFRSGTVAWVGLAAATYDKAFATGRYRDAEVRAADYLLTLRAPSGLIKGGSDVTWISTQHNLIAYVFLARLGDELQGAGDTTGAARYRAAAATIAAQIDKNLLVMDKDGAHFRQGVDDDALALDVQAFGAMYLQGTDRPALAAQVLAYANATFAVSHRSVEMSKLWSTYNLTYSSPGPFSGYAPYAGADAPDVRWAEGSGQMRLATAALGQDPGAIDESIASWAAITKGTGPLQADATVKNNAFGVEYHPWPATTAASWTVLSRTAPYFFAAPLPADTRLVTAWSKVRGGNLVTTYPDGRADMTTAGVERRILSGSTTATDYTVTADATLFSGAGYGVYVRANADSATKLTGYCVQLDHAYGAAGQIVVREILSDYELTVPVGRANPPTGFAWYGVPHTVGVMVLGNTLNVTIDGAQILKIPDLAAASAVSVKYNFGADSTLGPPTAGGYGIRAWGNGSVQLAQMTVAAAG